MAYDELLKSESGHPIPKYGQKPFKSGMYLALFHGRLRRDDAMNDWGFEGPLIGPLQWAHTTYACHLRILFASADDEANYFDAVEYPEARHALFGGDLIEYDGKFYGDWSIFHVACEETRNPPDRFRKVKRHFPSVAANDQSCTVEPRHAAA